MTTMTLLTRDARALERREAAPRPASWNAEARTIDVVAATGSAVPIGDYDEILDVNGADLSRFTGAHVLNGHAQGSVENVIGSVERAWIESDQIIATVRFSDRSEVQGIVGDIASGIIRGCSIGFEVEQWAEGANGDRRVRTAIKWRPRELSFVCVPADARAMTRQHEGRASINREIRTLARSAGIDSCVADDCIDRELSAEQARAAMFEHLRQQPTIRTTHVTLDNPGVFVRAAGEALYSRINLAHRPSGPAQGMVHWRIEDYARECLRRSGESVTGLNGPALVTRALGLHTTSDFPALLGDTVYRVLRAAYSAAPSVIRQLARQITVADFRATNRIVLDPSGFKLEKVNEHGEYKSGSFVEGSESIKVETFGKIFGATRQLLINDNLGALADMPAMLGRQAAAFEADQLVDLLEGPAGVGPKMGDNKAVFHTDHANLAAAPGDIGDEAVGAARLAMRRQTGPAGELISVAPKFLLVAPDIELEAEKFLATIYPAATSDVNVWGDRLTLLVEPRLSGDAFYLFADPADSETVTVAYLSGNEGPQVESQPGWRIDGIEWKVREDFGAAWADYRGAYMVPVAP
jgi:hypothetical protein